MSSKLVMPPEIVRLLEQAPRIRSHFRIAMVFWVSTLGSLLWVHNNRPGNSIEPILLLICCVAQLAVILTARRMGQLRRARKNYANACTGTGP